MVSPQPDSGCGGRHAAYEGSGRGAWTPVEVSAESQPTPVSRASFTAARGRPRPKRKVDPTSRSADGYAEVGVQGLSVGFITTRCAATGHHSAGMAASRGGGAGAVGWVRASPSDGIAVNGARSAAWVPSDHPSRSYPPVARS